MFRKALQAGGVGMLLLCCSAFCWADTLFEEDFEGGLGTWGHSSGVSIGTDSPSDGNTADIVDTEDSNYLYYSINLGIGTFTLDFDFLNAISSGISYEGSLDTVFVGLRYTNDDTYDLSSSYHDPLSLYYSEPATPYEDNFGGTITPNTTIGGDWQHYSTTFTSYDQYTVLTVFVDGYNGTAEDSLFRIDNIVITGDSVTPVPEPATGIVFGLGALGLCLSSRIRRRMA